MIKSNHEYNITQTWIKKFKQSLLTLENNKEKQIKNIQKLSILQESYQERLINLELEIAEYNYLINHNINEPLILTINSLTELGTILIKVRIAFKITPLMLANITGLLEETIISYEEQEYQNASFIDVLTVSEVFGIKIDNGVLKAELDQFYLRSSIPILI